MLTRLTLLSLLTLLAAAPASRPANLPVYQGRYYVIHTDLIGNDLRESELRMSKMAEEYRNRTRGFSGDIRQKLPFFLFRKEDDYYTAGGKRGSAGVFDPNRNVLMAIAGEHVDDYTWQVVQHEGFHQFAAAVIGGELPVWVNEGLAEYFGEGVFTGDGFVTGAVPGDRLARVKKEMAEKKFRSIRGIMTLSHRDWNNDMSLANYDQAWSMVQFLAHGEDGKYQDALVGFMRAIGKGQQWQQAWLANFGSAEGFEKKWQAYWQAQPAEGTTELYARATVQTLTSCLARAAAQKQKFATPDDLVAAMGNGTLKVDDRDWLPSKLIKTTAAEVDELKKDGAQFAFMPASIVCTLSNGKRLTGQFKLQAGRVAEVVVK